MSNFDEILNQGKKKEADVQTAESTDKKDKKEWADEQKRKRDSLFEMIEAVCPTIVSVDIKTVQNYPSDKAVGAYFDVKDNCIYAKSGMNVNDIFTSVSQALACAEMAKQTKEPFRVSDHEFQARCVAYVLAKKYSVPSDQVNLYSMPARYAGYDGEQIKKELSEIHGSVKAITNRMNEILLERPKEQNKKRNDKEAR